VAARDLRRRLRQLEKRRAARGIKSGVFVMDQGETARYLLAGDDLAAQEAAARAGAEGYAFPLIVPGPIDPEQWEIAAEQHARRQRELAARDPMHIEELSRLRRN